MDQARALGGTSLQRGRGSLTEFRDFVLRGNVVDLAVAVVIGAAFGDVVKATVEDIITPIIAAVGGQPDFSRLTFTINNSVFKYGDWINRAMTFLIIAAVVFFLVVKPMNILLTRFKPKTPDPAPTRKCPECLSDVPMAARKCAFYQSALTPAAA